MEQQRERLVEELRMAERAQELLAGLENHLVQLDRLAGSLPEGHVVRLLVEDAAEYARARGAGKAGSVVSRSRSKIEGRISTLRGILDRQNALSSIDA